MSSTKIKTQKLAGFRDFLPEEARKREYVISTIKSVFTSFGFEPLETPAIEYRETLMGKYGSEADKLIYQFKDRGGREVGLRYDLTVPLARVVAQYQNELPFPFKRYQIQPVWRAEKPQSGRYREFLQCDIDTVGTDSPLADAEIILCVLAVAKALGFKNAFMAINDRTIFDNLGLSKEAMIIIDKLEKIGKEEVIKELEKKNIKDAKEIFTLIEKSSETPRLKEIFSFLTAAGLKKGKDFVFARSLARGLEYYTSTIFELKSENYKSGSLAGGGRYDKLIGLFTGKDLPAVGVSFGLERIIEAMGKQGLLKNIPASSAKVLVTVFSPEFLDKSLETTLLLRSNRVSCEIYPDPKAKIDKQLKYADKKGIPYVVIFGPNEVRDKTVTIKNMKTGRQKTVKITSLLKYLKERGS